MIKQLPHPPTMADAANFDDRADAFLAALPEFATQANSTADEMNAREAKTKELKTQTEELKDQTKTLKDETLALKNETQTLKDQTNSLKDESLALKNESLELKNQSNALKNETMAFRNEAKAFKDQSATMLKQIYVSGLLRSDKEYAMFALSDTTAMWVVAGKVNRIELIYETPKIHRYIYITNSTDHQVLVQTMTNLKGKFIASNATVAFDLNEVQEAMFDTFEVRVENYKVPTVTKNGKVYTLTDFVDYWCGYRTDANFYVNVDGQSVLSITQQGERFEMAGKHANAPYKWKYYSGFSTNLWRNDGVIGRAPIKDVYNYFQALDCSGCNHIRYGFVGNGASSYYSVGNLYRYSYITKDMAYFKGRTSFNLKITARQDPDNAPSGSGITRA